MTASHTAPPQGEREICYALAKRLAAQIDRDDTRHLNHADDDEATAS